MQMRFRKIFHWANHNSAIVGITFLSAHNNANVKQRQNDNNLCLHREESFSHPIPSVNEFN